MDDYCFIVELRRIHTHWDGIISLCRSIISIKVCTNVPVLRHLWNSSHTWHSDILKRPQKFEKRSHFVWSLLSDFWKMCDFFFKFNGILTISDFIIVKMKNIYMYGAIRKRRWECFRGGWGFQIPRMQDFIR